MNEGKPLTGRKVFMIFAAAFGVIITVNIVMAVQAVGTFPGLETRNSYLASQQFEERRIAQENLGWTLETGYADGLLTLAFTDRNGSPVAVETLDVLVGRTTASRDDVTPDFTPVRGHYAAPVELDGGKWLVRVDAVAPDGTRFSQRHDLFVR
jgi:nitrogen fixation protein FixH